MTTRCLRLFRRFRTSFNTHTTHSSSARRLEISYVDDFVNPLLKPPNTDPERHDARLSSPQPNNHQCESPPHPDGWLLSRQNKPARWRRNSPGLALRDGGLSEEQTILLATCMLGICFSIIDLPNLQSSPSTDRHDIPASEGSKHGTRPPPFARIHLMIN